MSSSKKLKIVLSNQFKRDLKLAKKRGYDIDKLTYVVNLLAERKTLDEKYRDHQLSGPYSEFRECHVQADWLLIYRNESELELFLFRNGTHSDLF